MDPELMKMYMNLLIPYMPKIAYNIVYSDLARRISTYSFYMFNFLEEKEIIKLGEKVSNIILVDNYVVTKNSFANMTQDFLENQVEMSLENDYK